VAEVTPEVARLEFVGKVEGRQYGANDQIELKAKCRFDRKQGRIDWFAMRVKHTREIGLVEGGVDVVALMQIKILHKDSSERLADAALKDIPLKPTDDLCKLAYEPAAAGWRLLHDRSWFLTEHYRDQDVFHRVEGGQDLALCKISPMTKSDPAKLAPLKQFQADVQQRLGENFGTFLEASESTNDANYRVYRVAVQGTDEKVPVRWFFYLLMDEQGRQAALAFHVEEKQIQAFGKADLLLADSLRFVEKKGK
jgi:hypothetical protein